MIEHIILGAIQGITEWIPVSSEGCVIGLKNYVSGPQPLNILISYSLFLHLGTCFAALIYFRRDIVEVCASVFPSKQQSPANRNLLVFLTITTIISAGLGESLSRFATEFVLRMPQATAAITSLIAACLIITGFLQLNSQKKGERKASDTSILDAILLGITQGLATMPGLSRSGSTIAMLTIRGFGQDQALKISFLMSIPLILAGNLIKNQDFLFSAGPHWMGFATSFAIGIISIGPIMHFAKKVNFGIFLICVGGAMALSLIFLRGH